VLQCVENMPYSALAVANSFLERSLRSGRGLTPLQVMKLTYLSHGMYLAVTGANLISEGIQAWKYGPVIESLYHRLKPFGAAQITSLQPEFEGAMSPPSVPPGSPADQVLDAVWAKYGHMTGPQLSTMTHESGSPWWVVWEERGGKNQSRALIPNQLIQGYFQQILHGAESNRANPNPA
jgi:uncharacterized phage-associated protein